MDPSLHKAPIFPQDPWVESELAPHREGEACDASLSTVPPYWQYHRFESYASVDIIRPPAIILEDHTENENEPGCSSPLWAKAVSLEDHVMVSGSATSVGDYIVWSCKIDTLDVGVSSFSPHRILASLKRFTSLSVDVHRVGRS